MQVSAMSSERTFQNCSNIERVVAPLIIAATYCFYECAKLKSLKVYAPNNSNEKNSGIYLGCANLETIEFSTIYNGSFSLEDSPKINSTTIGNFIKKYNSTSPITITVHPDVYAKLTDENNTEWNSLLTLASSKNIQFATA